MQSSIKKFYRQSVFDLSVYYCENIEEGRLEENKNELLKALLKRALGFEVEEVAEEFVRSSFDGELVLMKRKVSKHFVQPEVNAMKILLSLTDELPLEELEKLTAEELGARREALLKQLG